MTGEIFQEWPKTPRLFKNMVITEKLDGTNAAVVIKKLTVDTPWIMGEEVAAVYGEDFDSNDESLYIVWAQSKNRLIQPGKGTDNAGFAAWVSEHAEKLVETLGEGYHYGEWWGNGIQRGYGLEKGDKRFSLFNTKRWGHFNDPFYQADIPGLGCVPVLLVWEFDTEVVSDTFWELRDNGSQAVPGYMNPEGIVVYHTAADQVFKMTDSGDMHKGEIAGMAATVSSIPSAA